ALRVAYRRPASGESVRECAPRGNDGPVGIFPIENGVHIFMIRVVVPQTSVVGSYHCIPGDSESLPSIVVVEIVAGRRGTAGLYADCAVGPGQQPRFLSRVGCVGDSDKGR